MTDSQPLMSFFISLEAYGFHLTVNDYNRIYIALGSGGQWSMTRLRHVLCSIIVTEKTQLCNFNHCFNTHFNIQLDTLADDLDINVQDVLNDLTHHANLEAIPVSSHPLNLLVNPFSKISKNTLQLPKNFRIQVWTIISLIIVLIFMWGSELNYDNYLSKRMKDASSQKSNDNELSPLNQSANSRIYPNVPVIQSIQFSSIPDKYKWKKFFWFSILLSSLCILYALFLWFYQKTPNDKAPKWQSNLSQYYPIEKIGGSPAKRLDDHVLSNLLKTIGVVLNHQSTQAIDIEASIQKTIAHYGNPQMVCSESNTPQKIIILLDILSKSISHNTIAYELEKGLLNKNIPVLLYKFRGSPDQIYDQNGSRYNLYEFDAHRSKYLVLIFSDGKWIANTTCTYFLELMSQWPMVAWLELRSQPFWDESTLMPIQYGIPLYPATNQGLIDIFHHFFTEKAPKNDYSKAHVKIPRPIIQKGCNIATFLDAFLKDCLPLAQASAMIQPVSIGLIDKIRKTFFPQLQPESSECIISIPGTTCTIAGLHFSKQVLACLRAGFANRLSHNKQEQIIHFIITEIKKTEPHHIDSPAHLKWEWSLERVRLELTPDAALKRLSKLSKTPLGQMIKDSFLHTVLPDTDIERKFGIPLRIAPKTRDGKQRLSALAPNIGIPLLKNYPIPKFLWSILILLSLSWACVTGVCGYYYLISKAMLPSIQFTSETPINSIIRFDDLKKDHHIQTMVDNHDLDSIKWQFKPFHTYRLSLFGDGNSQNHVLDAIDKNYTIQLAQIAIAHPCIMIDDALGLTTIRCAPNGIHKKTWHETMKETQSEKLGPQSIQNRLISIGIEIGYSQLNDSTIIGNRLLETGSIDVYYQIRPSVETSKFQKALLTIQSVIEPWTLEQAQLIVWGNNTSVQSLISMLGEVGRMVILPSHHDIVQMNNLLFPGKTSLISETEIISKIPNAYFQGKQYPLLLFRPMTSFGSLTVNTFFNNTFINSRVVYIKDNQKIENKGGEKIELPTGIWQVTAYGNNTLQSDSITVEVQNNKQSIIDLTLKWPSNKTAALSIIAIPKDRAIQTGQYLTHIVQPGETLMGLFRIYHKTPKQIKEFNSLTNSTIHIGQQLIIPISVLNATFIIKNEYHQFKIQDTHQITLNEGIWQIKAIAKDGLISDWLQVNLIANQDKTILIKVYNPKLEQEKITQETIKIANIEKQKQRQDYNSHKPRITPSIVLRSQPKQIIDHEAKAMVKKYNFYDNEWNSLGSFENDFVLNKEQETILDKRTGLMWQQSGSDDSLTYKEAEHYLNTLKVNRFAGYSDWRIPTLEELNTLLECVEYNGLYIDLIFNSNQLWCWSSDLRSPSSRWGIHFGSGDIIWGSFEFHAYVKAVRTVH